MSLATENLQKCVHEASRREMHAHEQEQRKNRQEMATFTDDLQIPDPNLFSSLKHLERRATEDLPTVAECAVHLQLLQCFHRLHQQVLQSNAMDEQLEILPQPRTVKRYGKQVRLRDRTFDERRKEKWPIFIKLATTRFILWVDLLERTGGYGLNDTSSLDEAPALDILMAWHSFLLNPEDYMDFCRQCELKVLPNLSFPWSQIHRRIDPTNWSYQFPKQESSSQKERFLLEPSLFDYLTTNAPIRDRRAILKFAKDGDNSFFIPRRQKSEFSGDSDDLASPIFHICLSQEWPWEIRQAIERQTSFVQKMNNQLWIRSPVLEGTIDRGIERYEKFLKLFKYYPKQMFVPTLDIDLVWHTHQCSARQYEVSVIHHAGRFVNHNDKLGISTLDPSMETTKRLWKMRFGQEYLRCLCWDCETLLSAIEAISDSDRNSQQMEHLASKVVQNVVDSRAAEMRMRAEQVDMRNGQTDAMSAPTVDLGKPRVIGILGRSKAGRNRGRE